MLHTPARVSINLTTLWIHASIMQYNLTSQTTSSKTIMWVNLHLSFDMFYHTVNGDLDQEERFITGLVLDLLGVANKVAWECPLGPVPNHMIYGCSAAQLELMRFGVLWPGSKLASTTCTLGTRPLSTVHWDLQGLESGDGTKEVEMVFVTSQNALPWDIKLVCLDSAD